MKRTLLLFVVAVVVRVVPVLVLALALLPLSGCEVVGGIFKAGMWVGIVLVVLVLAGLLWIAGKLRR